MDHSILQKLEEYFKNTPKEQIEKDWLNILKGTDSEAYYERKYKDSLERMKSWVKGEHPECFCEAQKAAEFIFPELKEPEDEKMRKMCIRYLDRGYQHCSFADDMKNIEKCIAWLEKQGEQPHAVLGQSEVTKASDQKLEPKFNFKVGQWIVATGKRVYLIAKIDGFNVTLVDTNGDEYVFHVSSLVDAYQWTIADAKDGDVLVCPSDLGDRLVVFIFKQLVNNASEIDCHCCIDANGIFDPCLNDCCYVGDVSRDDYIPATKEQRDLLFHKMKEAGYEWNAEKKELKMFSFA